MLKIIQSGDKITLRIEYHSGVQNWHTDFCLTTNSELVAELQGTAMRKALRDALSTIREEAYNRGWKDAKAKTAKMPWFSGIW